MEAHGRSNLVLDWHDHKVTHDGGDSTLVLGSQPDVDLRLPREFTSRHHARIERRNHDFVLVDTSTNGTYVQTEDERVTYVHHGVLRLWGEGWISLGEPLSGDAAIRFQHR
jgi:pSer/pThr/pTyr-binding forkhead associated (FHA) protein